MKKNKRKLFGLAVLVVGLLSASLVIVSARARNRTLVIRKANDVTSPGPQTLHSIASAQRPRALAQIEAEIVTIKPHGFEPAEITRPQGRFLLMVDNRSGLEAVSLRLTREGGPRVREMRVPREEPDWSEVVDLEPGRYLLTEANHSRWVCVITISG